MKLNNEHTGLSLEQTLESIARIRAPKSELEIKRMQRRVLMDAAFLGDFEAANALVVFDRENPEVVAGLLDE